MRMKKYKKVKEKLPEANVKEALKVVKKTCKKKGARSL